MTIIDQTQIAVVEVTEQKWLKLPPAIGERLNPADRFILWWEGDTLHLKSITPPTVLERVAQAPEEDTMSLDEINALVHEVRRQRHCASS